MTVEKFMSMNFTEAVKFEKLGYVKNKTLSKIFKRYKHIDVKEYWFDDPYDPNEWTWLDVEGIGYGWLWIGYKSKKEMRKAVIKYALESIYKEEIWTFERDGIKNYIFSLGRKVVRVRLSNHELESTSW